MQNRIYDKAREFKNKYSRTVAFRLKAHAKVAERFLGSDEERRQHTDLW